MLIVCSEEFGHCSTPQLDYLSFWVSATASPIYSHLTWTKDLFLQQEEMSNTVII
jgi:hypothetical protein